MKRLLCLFFCALLLAPAWAAGEGATEEATDEATDEATEKATDEWAVIPDALRVTVETVERAQANGERAEVDQITTRNQTVTAEVSRMIERLYDRHVPGAGCENEQLELNASYRITGDRWASFYAIARVTRDRQTVSLHFDCASYDMVTGERLKLGGLFREDSGALDMLSQRLRESLEGVYPSLDRSESAIDALVSTEALADAAFVLGTGQLMLPVSLGEIVSGKKQIYQTILYYDEIDTLFTEEAARQTDNARYKVIALTFDDGPVGMPSRLVLKGLSRYGGNATFFVLGDLLKNYAEYARREMDEGHLVASHTMDHVYSRFINASYMRRDKQRFSHALMEATGATTNLFRAPGGHYPAYLDREIGWTNFHWSYTAADTGNAPPEQIASRVCYYAKNGVIVLMHDRVIETMQAVPMIMAQLREKNFMFASVEEMLRMNGYPPESNVSYKDASGPMAR